MAVRSLLCPSCAAPIQFEQTADRLSCPYCRTPLAVDRSGSAATLLADRIAGSIQDNSRQTRSAIDSGTAVTQAELRRLQLAQDLSTAQIRLGHVQSEIRAIQRLPVNRVTREQLGELRQQEVRIGQRIRSLDAAINPLGGTVDEIPPKTAQRGRGNLPWLLLSPQGRIGRGQFWLGSALLFGALFLIEVLSPAVEQGQTLPPQVVAALLVLLWSAFALTAKRYHDLGKASWWVLVILIPMIGPLWMLYETGFRAGEIGPNRYG